MRLIRNRTPVTDPPIASSSHSLLGPRCCSGGIHPGSPVILALVSPFPFSGGPPWRLTPGHMCWPALGGPAASLLTVLPLVSFGHCPSLVALGHKSPSTLSLDCPHLMATQSFTPSSTASPTHFIALPKLPSALETTKLLVQHIFRLHVIPSVNVSDRGPQFISQVWKAFCQALGASVSRSSGFHPQTNSQARKANQELEATTFVPGSGGGDCCPELPSSLPKGVKRDLHCPTSDFGPEQAHC